MKSHIDPVVAKTGFREERSGRFITPKTKAVA
jgi:hypothetical protein